MRALVFVCVHWCGGLGDRLTGIINSYIVSKESHRQFYIFAPTTFDNLVEPAQGTNWNASLPPACDTRHAINAIDSKNYSTLHAAAHGKAPCVTVRINVDNQHSVQERKQALSELFAPIQPPEHNYSVLHLRTGGNCAYRGIDPARDTIDKGITMLKRLTQLKLPIYIVSDCLQAKELLASQCRVRQVECVYRKGSSRHIDRQKTSPSDLANIWSDFRVIARAAAVERSRSGFSAVAAIWPLAETHSQITPAK